MMGRKGLGVVIGRFQVPSLHAGHFHIINQARKHKQTIVLIGVHPLGPSKNHPMDYLTRSEMIKSATGNQVTTSPIKDQFSDKKWSESVDNIIESHSQFATDVTIYAGRDSFKSHYSGKYKVVEVDEINNSISGTLVREDISEVVLNSEDFRRGAIYSSYNRFPVINSTVDIAMIRKRDFLGSKDDNADDFNMRSYYQCLLVQKPNQNNLWRFPGGFMDPRDENRLSCAKRELSEETGLEGGDWEHLGDFRVEDWRTTLGISIHTDLFACWHLFGNVDLKDDLKNGKFEWFKIDQLKTLNFADSHKQLADKVIYYLNNKIKTSQLKNEEKTL